MHENCVQTKLFLTEQIFCSTWTLFATLFSIHNPCHLHVLCWFKFWHRKLLSWGQILQWAMQWHCCSRSRNCDTCQLSLFKSDTLLLHLAVITKSSCWCHSMATFYMLYIGLNCWPDQKKYLVPVSWPTDFWNHCCTLLASQQCVIAFWRIVFAWGLHICYLRIWYSSDNNDECMWLWLHGKGCDTIIEHRPIDPQLRATQDTGNRYFSSWP